MRARLGGLKRAAFWRALGFPNMALARAAAARNREARKLEKARLEAEAKAQIQAYKESTRDL